ncbi:hypothetical protein DH2020_014490 [Rehmannia glutinosa]|uniref:Pectinesterase n=1 Tax=Rehmannia glutinosa TaxID=99300 RepID=A0ABR0X079_REHGL
MPSNCRLIIHVAILFVLLNANSTTCHTKGLRPKRSSGKQLSVNMTQVQYSEQQFMKWVDFVGSLKHTLFRTAKNKVFPSYTLTVDRNPVYGDFTSIQDAIDSLPMINVVRVVIRVHAGLYKEKVTIPPFKSFITIEGAGADKTIVEWGDTAQTPGPKGQPLGTYGSATFAVNSPYFIAKNITFKFLGAQDTLYDHLGRHYYKDCYIEGSVDFIFGNGLSLFENCHVHAIAPIIGAVTAQGRNSILDDTGFSFVNCKVTGSGALYLGRAWGPFSRVVFAYTYMDNIIIPKGWYNWGDPSRQMTVFYGQYKCTGAGASFAGRVSWSRELTDEEMERTRERIRAAYNRKVMKRNFQVGDLVPRRAVASKNKGKLDPNWEGPLRVVKVLAGGAYELEELNGKMLPRAWNVSNLKKYYP